MNKREGIIVVALLLTSFITGVFAQNPPQQILNVFVTNLPPTHLGQSTADLVTLSCVSPGNLGELSCQRIFPDGTHPDFSLGPSSVLVVTDIRWSGVNISPIQQPGTMETLTIYLRSPSGEANAVFRSSSTLDTVGEFAGSEHMTAGFVVSSTATMLAAAPNADLVHILMYGYMKTGQQLPTP